MNYKCIKKYKFVSFDLFDTLITRIVSTPSDVFDLVEKVYLKNNISKIKDFKNKRKAAEIEARTNCKYQEVTLDDIYKKLAIFYTEKELNKIKNLEKELEISLCVRNEIMYEYYKYCVKNNKKVIITSDMYLPKETIKKILHKNGYTSNYKVYVSSDTKVLKSTSKMYDYIINDLNITKKDIIHMGDNLYVDFIVPRLKGIKSLKVKKLRKSKSENLDTSIFKNYLSLLPKESDYFKNFGYKCLGPLLYGFSFWLKGEIEKSKNYNIFFLAREGKIMKESFELINDNPEIKTSYMYASRRALTVPALNKTKNDILESIIFTKINLNILFKRFGLDVQKYKSLIEKHGFDISESVYFKDKNLWFLIKEVASDIYKNSIEEEKIITQYLNQINFRNNVSVVDIGWFGSMQKYLNFFSNAKIYGYYLGLNVKESNTKKSFLFSKGKNRKLKEQKDLYSAILEVFLTADHGSAEKYENYKNKIKPVLYDYEYLDSKEWDYINKAQRSALDFIKLFNETTYGVIKLNPFLSFKNISKVGVRPTLKDVKELSSFSIYDGKLMKLIESKKLRFYICNPQKLIDDFYSSTWKVGFLKSVFKYNIRVFRLINKIYCRIFNL